MNTSQKSTKLNIIRLIEHSFRIDFVNQNKMNNSYYMNPNGGKSLQSFQTQSIQK